MKNEEYINISKAFSSSLVERVGASTTLNSFVPINEVAKAKGLISNRSLRIVVQKGKYIAREVKVNGGTSNIHTDSLFGGVKRVRSSNAADSSPLPPIRFDEAGFNGVYSNLGIKSVFAKTYNARAKVIERFFLKFQEEFEKMMPSYIGTSIEDKPAWLKRGEKLHKQTHQKTTKN